MKKTTKITFPIAYQHRKSYIIPRIGDVVVGYRYGKAPEDGYSYNTRDNRYESGVSMASVGYLPDVASFACVLLATSVRYYYRGVVADFERTAGFVLKTWNKSIKQIPAQARRGKIIHNKLSGLYPRGVWIADYNLHLTTTRHRRISAAMALPFARNDDELRARNEQYQQKREQAEIDYQNYLDKDTAKLFANDNSASAANQTAAHAKTLN